MDDSLQAEQGGGSAAVSEQEAPPTMEPTPQQLIQEQLAAELIATRQQLAAVQHQLAMEQAAAQQRFAADQSAAQQRYGQMIQSVEQFLEGEATVGDVVKTVGANVAQDDSLWKGALVGAAAAVLLTSTPVREAMGKSIGVIFPGMQQKTSPQPAGESTVSADVTAGKK